MKYFTKQMTILAAIVMWFASSLPAHAFLTDNLDGTLTSSTSGLMWHQNANLSGGSLSWADALSFVGDVNAGLYDNAGYTDWRLSGGSDCNSRPSGTNCFGSETFDLYWELLTEHSTFIYSANSPFVNGQFRTYWTSYEWSATNALAVDFNDGGQNDFDKTSTFFVLLVRDGQPMAVPEPATLFLLGFGLLGLGLRRLVK